MTGREEEYDYLFKGENVFFKTGNCVQKLVYLGGGRISNCVLFPLQVHSVVYRIMARAAYVVHSVICAAADSDERSKQHHKHHLIWCHFYTTTLLFLGTF